MNKSFILLSVLLFIFPLVYAQKVIDASHKIKPDWFVLKPMSDDYQYYIGSGVHDIQQEAKDQAITDVLQQLSNEGKFTIELESKTQVQQKTVSENDQKTRKEIFDFEAIMKSTGEKVTIKGLRTEEEYWILRESEGKLRYEYYVLMRRPKNPNAPADYNAPQGYGLAPLYRSAIVPGWGQLYKKEKSKGLTLLVGEGFLISGAVISHTFNTSYYNKALQTQNIEIRRTYLSNSDSWSSARNVFVIAAAGVYVYNIIDAITAKGAKRYAIYPELQLHPVIGPDAYFLAINFSFK